MVGVVTLTLSISSTDSLPLCDRYVVLDDIKQKGWIADDDATNMYYDLLYQYQFTKNRKVLAVVQGEFY